MNDQFRIPPEGLKRRGEIVYFDQYRKYAVIRMPGDDNEYITTDSLHLEGLFRGVDNQTDVYFVPHRRGNNCFALDVQWTGWISLPPESYSGYSVFNLPGAYPSKKSSATIPQQPARPPSTFYDFGSSYARNTQSNLTPASSNVHSQTVPSNYKDSRALSANAPPSVFAPREDSNFAAFSSHSSAGFGFRGGQQVAVNANASDVSQQLETVSKFSSMPIRSYLQSPPETSNAGSIANKGTINSSASPCAINQENDGQVPSEEILHKQLNEWYRVPIYFNTQKYPFPCGGFVVPSTTPEKTIMVFTRRLGCIVRPEDPARNGRPYAYFMVCGPGNYRAWEYDEFQPASFKSTKYVNSTEIEMKGYALMAPGTRDMPESSWWAWNDHTGLMKCQVNCARILKKKYSSWEPTCQYFSMVMFDATSIDNGRHWTIKTLSYIDYQFADKQKVWPQQAYYLEDLEVLPKENQRNPGEEITFYSPKIGDLVVAKLEHIRFLPKNHTLFTTKFAAVIITVWGNDGLTRKLQCLMAAPTLAWADDRNAGYMELSGRLRIASWDEEIYVDTAVNQEPFKRYQVPHKEVQPSNRFGSKTPLKPVPEEEEW